MPNFDPFSVEAPPPRAAEPPAEPREPEQPAARADDAIARVVDEIAAGPLGRVHTLDLSAAEADADQAATMAAIAHLLARRGHAVAMSVVPTEGGGQKHRVWLVDRAEHDAAF